VSPALRRGAEATSLYRAVGDGNDALEESESGGVAISTGRLTKPAGGPGAAFWVKTALAGVLVVLLTATGLVASRKPVAAATLALPATPAMALSSSLLVPLDPGAGHPQNPGASPLAESGTRPAGAPGGDASPPTPDTPSPSPAPPTVAGILPDGRVVLNAASEDDLRKLPRVGPSRARSILALRAKLGKFRSVNDLLRVKGIGRKTLERMKPKLVVDPPPPEPNLPVPSAPPPKAATPA
jgi:competence protein ComEA